MLAHSQDFKQAITSLGRDIKIKILCTKLDGKLTAEDNKLILTENNANIILHNETQNPEIILNEDNIYMLKKNNYGELFRTYMKSFDLKTPQEFNLGDKLIIQVGTTVNGEPEYLDYGTFYIYTKEFDEVDKTFSYQLCDSTIFTMQKFETSRVFSIYETQMTNSTLLKRILGVCGLVETYEEGVITKDNVDVGALVNSGKYVYKSTLDGMNLTYRDVLDMICQANGCSLVMVDRFRDGERHLYIDTVAIDNTPVDTIDEDILKDEIVKFEKKYGPINSLVISRADGNDNIVINDEQSIEDNGLTQYYIENNLILEQDNRDDYKTPLFNRIKDTEFYLCDLKTQGLGYIEYLDYFTTIIGDKSYNCICLKDIMTLDNGLEEDFTTEEPVETTQEYQVETIGDKEATIKLDKLNGTMVLKTDSNGKIAQVRLDSSGDSGSLVAIDADEIDFTSHTFNLTTDDINITSDNFGVDENGSMWCTDAEIRGGTIQITSPDNSASIWVNGTGQYSSYYSYMYPDHTDVTDGSNSCVCTPTHLYVAQNGSSYRTDIYKDSIQTGTTTRYISMGSTDPYLEIHDGNNRTRIEDNVIYSGVANSTQFIAEPNHYAIGTPYANEIYAWTSGTDPYLVISKGSTSGSILIDHNGIYRNAGEWGNNKLYLGTCYEENGYLNAGNLAFGTTSGINYLNANSGDLKLQSPSTIYANGVAIGGYSDKTVKENIKELTNEDKENLLKEIRELPIYSYDIKEEYGGQKDNLGIIIQDFENNEILGKVLHITEYREKKKYNHEDLSQVNLILIKTLLEKIDKLEKELEEVKNGRD